MATTQIAFAAVGDDMSNAPYFGGATVESISVTGTSAATTAASKATQGVCRVATDTAVYVTFAASPTASASNGFLCPANSVSFFRVGSGLKAAAITV